MRVSATFMTTEILLGGTPRDEGFPPDVRHGDDMVANRQEICSCHITNRTARLFIEWLPRGVEFRHEVMQVEDYVRQGALGRAKTRKSGRLCV